MTPAFAMIISEVEKLAEAQRKFSAESAGRASPGRSWLFVINTSCLYQVYVRGEAYVAAGQGSAAA